HAVPRRERDDARVKPAAQKARADCRRANDDRSFHEHSFAENNGNIIANIGNDDVIVLAKHTSHI
ncbi:MAG: hypothetical protein SPK87_06445, partial [Bacteroidales bacterium]|nr:hypothetical protein [Bacteroidales bacterium]